MYFELMYLDRQVMKIARLRDPLFITESELLLAPDCSEHSNRTPLYTHDCIRQRRVFAKDICLVHKIL